MAFEERDFFTDKFTRAEIAGLLRGRLASEMFNPRSPSVKATSLEPDKLSNEELIDLMLKEPRLVRRPVVRIGGEVYSGANTHVLEGLLKQEE